jgi:cytochrome c biogenesis protein CcdA
VIAKQTSAARLQNIVIVSFLILFAMALAVYFGFIHPHAPMAEMSQYLPAVTLGSVIVGGLIDGINPCAFTVLILFVTAMLATLQASTSSDIGAARARIIGLGSIYIASVFLTYLALGVGGFLIGLCTVLCSGAVYLAVLSLLSMQSSALVGFAYLVLYNLMFILPLVALLIATSARPTLNKLADWNLHHKEWVRLTLGSGVVVMGLTILATV